MYPKGIGLYLRALNEQTSGTPKQAAAKAQAHAVSFVTLMTAWQDVDANGKDRMLHSNGRDATIIRAYADAFSDAGIDVWLWGFPRAGGEDEYIARFAHVTDVCGDTIKGWIHDPEVFFKWGSKVAATATQTGMRGQPEYSADAVPLNKTQAWIKTRAGILLEKGRAAGFGDERIGITSYGMAPGHKNFPWDVFGGHGFGSPQLYSVGAQDVDRGIAAWRAHGWRHIVPSVPLYGKNSGAALHEHLSHFVDGAEHIAGFIFWSWQQGSPAEWGILKRWADWLVRGACVLPEV